MRGALRYFSYPLILGTTFLVGIWLSTSPWATFALAAVTLTGVLSVAALERLAPYHRAWTKDHGDLAADVQYNLLSAALIQASVYLLYPLSADFISLRLWPTALPFWIDVLVVGIIIDFGLYWMHRWSHVSPLLWRFHQPHHSAERLYWLNGERRHVVSALLFAGPGLFVVAVLGAPQATVAAWFAILPVHLAFQHANVDYTLGPLRFILGVAEMHRWHHKRDYEDAQVNFGEVLLIWDWLFGTAHDDRRGVDANEVGLRDASYPRGFWRQHLAAFNRRAT